MQSTLLNAPSEEGLGIDYKQFIREFESYRNGHPEASFHQALDTFLEDDLSHGVSGEGPEV